MERTMRLHAWKTVGIWVLICAVAGALLLGLVTGTKAFTLLGGPQTLDSVPEDALDGAYVSFDKARLVATYASASVTDANGAENESEYYIILRYQEKYITLLCSPKQYETMSAALAQSESFYTGELDKMTGMGEVRGFVEPADESSVSMMAEQMEKLAERHKETGLPGMDGESQIADYILPWQVNMGHAGWMPFWLVWAASSAWLILFAVAAVLLVLLVTGYYQRQYHAYIARTAGSLTKEQIEADWNNAQIFDSIRLGDLYTWFFKGPYVYAFQTPEIAWVYKALYPRTSDKYRWGITVYLNDHTKREMYMPQDANRAKIIRAYQEKGLVFVSDYKSSYEKLFAGDFPAFQALAREEKETREQKAREKAMWEQV